jgi:general secretion pathway protein G
MYKQFKKMREEEGFTLIELLIVIVILGILAAIVVFSVQGITDKGDSAACSSDVTEVDTAVEAAYAQLGHYPESAADVTPFFHGGTLPTKYFTLGYDASGKTAPTFTAVGTTPTGCTLS